MEIRILRYFLAAAREENITRAAAQLHITQPTLSRQLHQLEEEIGKKLYIRSNYNIKLTDEGMLLRKRAQEIIDLEEKTLAEFQTGEDISGNIYIGSGESYGIRFIGYALEILRSRHPDIHYLMISGDGNDIGEKLNRGLIDFGVFIGKVNLKNYNYLKLPVKETFGLLLTKDDPLAQKEAVQPEDLLNRPLLFSRQTIEQGEFVDWLGYPIEELNIIGMHNLTYNASLMVEEGLAAALTLQGIINTTGESRLCFRPFFPNVTADLVLAWKRDAMFSPASEKFLETVQKLLKEDTTYTAESKGE